MDPDGRYGGGRARSPPLVAQRVLVMAVITASGVTADVSACERMPADAVWRGDCAALLQCRSLVGRVRVDLPPTPSSLSRHGA